jgi:hypothetical protein
MTCGCMLAMNTKPKPKPKPLKHKLRKVGKKKHLKKKKSDNK